MSGTIIPIFSRRRFDFSNLGAGGTTSFEVAKGFDSSQYTEGALLVRVHSGTNIGDTATVLVSVLTWAPSQEDPAKNSDFLGTTAATVTVTSSHTGPNLLKGDFSGNFGGQLLVGVLALQDTNSEESMIAVLSAELVLKA
jgi:hypothetical protein